MSTQLQAERFAARPVALLVDELADALDWPRSRPVRLLSGDRATLISSLVICTDEAALFGLDAPIDTAAILATPPSSNDGTLGRRHAYDPFATQPDDLGSWRNSARVVLEASLPLAGCSGGVDEQVAARAGLQPAPGETRLEPIRPVRRDVSKLVMYVPTEAAERVRESVFDAGAGQIGEYDRCSWYVIGTGTFRGSEDTNPTIGSPGSFEQVEEARIEVVVPDHLLRRVLRAYRAAHPYEVAAYDVHPMGLTADAGFGRLGVLGSGGGAAAWSALAQLDPDLAAYGRVDQVAAGAGAAVYAGPLRDVFDDVLSEPQLELLIIGAATDAELGLLVSRGVSVLVLNRTRAVDGVATELAGRITRALTLPVTVAGALHFPSSDAGEQPAAAGTPAAAAPAAYETGTWRLHFDGGSRGNPGPAAYGWVLYTPDGEEHEADGVRIGTATNNVAEWTGLLRGLEHARDRGIRSLSVRGDSELVVKQVTGVYKVKNAALKPLAEQVAAVLRDFDSVDVQHVYRDANARADAVANEAMDGIR